MTCRIDSGTNWMCVLFVVVVVVVDCGDEEIYK
jgi:hypothetical protein